MPSESPMTKEEKHNEYLWYKSRGICVSCRHREAMADRTRCPECSYKKFEYDIALHSTDEYRAKHRADAKEKYKRYREAGLCINCGKPSNGKARCDICGHRASVNQLKNRSKKRPTRAQREILDLCNSCGKNKRMEGRTICSCCYQRLYTHMTTVVWPADREAKRRKADAQGSTQRRYSNGYG